MSHGRAGVTGDVGEGMACHEDDGGGVDLPQPCEKELALWRIAVETVRKSGASRVDSVELGL